MFTGSRSKLTADKPVQNNKTAGTSAPGKGPPPALSAAPGGKRPPAFPSIDSPATRTPSWHSPAKRTPTWSSAHERPPKRSHHAVFPTNSNRDLSQQPIRYSRDQSKDDENLGKEESRHNSARFEVISISSDNDEGPDSDDEPLEAVRKRRMTSGTPNLSKRQQKKQEEPGKIPSQPSSTAPNTLVQANTPQISHAESLPSTAKKIHPAGHVSRTSSECRADTGMSEDSQSSQGSKSHRGKISLPDDRAMKGFANRDSPNISNVVADPNKVHAPADGFGKERVSATSTSVEKENQDLKAKLEEMTTENQALAKHLREARDLSKNSNKIKLESERELSRVWEKVADQIQQINALTSESIGHRNTISKLRDKASQDEKDARQSMLSLQNQVNQYQKLLDDQATQNMSLDATVKDLRKKADASKATKLEASNRELGEKNKKLEKTNSQIEQEIVQAKDQYNALKEEKSEMLAQNDRLQLRLEESEHQLQQKSSEHAVAEDGMKRQIEELQKQVGSQRDEVGEYETRVADLREEVDWYKGNRERIKEAWDERVAMEMKWRDDLLAIINNNNMPAAEMRRAALAAPDPIQQAAQRDAQRGSAQQQSAPQQTTQQQTAQPQSAQQQSTQQQISEQQTAQPQFTQQQPAQRQAAKRGASRGGSSSGRGSRASR